MAVMRLGEVVSTIQGLLRGDQEFIRPILKSELTQQYIDLPISVRKNMKDDRPVE